MAILNGRDDSEFFLWFLPLPLPAAADCFSAALAKSFDILPCSLDISLDSYYKEC